MHQDILNLIREGKYLIAIKRYREVYNVGFLEAEKAVFDIKKDFAHYYKEGGHASDLNYDYPTICARVKDYLDDGNKLRAVKFYQDNCNVDFAEALNVVQAIEKGQL